MATNVPALTFTDTGVSLPAESDILSGVQADQNAAFDGNLNLALETPQGQLATTQTAIIAEKNSEIAYLTNMIDPAYSSGRYQDAIGRIYWQERKAGFGTSVVALLTGLEGVNIPAGTTAKDVAGNTYYSQVLAVIPAAGSMSTTFVCSVNGPLACPAGTLTTIYKSIPGWDSIINVADGILGELTESRVDFEYRRKNSVASNAHGTAAAIRGAVFGVAGVTDCYVVQNMTADVALIGSTNYGLAPRAVYVGVVGGAPMDVGAAILSKNPGCPMSGNTSIVIPDTNYSYPRPEYIITYNIPTALPVKVQVNIRNNPGLPYNYVELIKAAVKSAFSGADGGERARIGAQIVAGRFYAGVAAISLNINILAITMGAVLPIATSVTPGIDQIPTIIDNDITVNLVG